MNNMIKYIGNYISDVEIDSLKEFKRTDKIDENVPTIIIGLDKVYELIKDFNINQYKINDNLFITPSKSEKNNDFNERCNNFIITCYNRFINEITVKELNYNSTLTDYKIFLYNIENYNGNFLRHKNTLYVYVNEIMYTINVHFLKLINIKNDNLIRLMKKLTNVNPETIINNYPNIVAFNSNYHKFLLTLN